MGHRIANERDQKWYPRKGLEGPFVYPNGRVAYYDPKEGAYYDPTTDFYLSYEEARDLTNQVFDKIRGK